MLNVSQHQNTEKLDAWASKQPGASGAEDTKFLLVRQTIVPGRGKHDGDMLEETVVGEFDNLAAADEELRRAFFVSSPNEFLSLRYRGVEVARRTGAAPATAKIQLRVSQEFYNEIRDDAAEDLDVDGPLKSMRELPKPPAAQKKYREVSGAACSLSSKAALRLCIDVHNREYGPAVMLQIEETPGIRVIVAAIAEKITPENLRFVGDFPVPLTRPKTVLYSGDTCDAVMEEICRKGCLFAINTLPVAFDSVVNQQ